MERYEKCFFRVQSISFAFERTIFAYWRMRKTVCIYTPIISSHIIATIADKPPSSSVKKAMIYWALHIRIFALGHFRFAHAPIRKIVRSNANEIDCTLGLG